MDKLLTRLQTGEAYTQAELCEVLHIDLVTLLDQISVLKAQGYTIQEKGQQISLQTLPNSLLPGYIHMDLATQQFGRGAILYAPEMGSTNTELRQAAMQIVLPQGSIAVCEQQTAGKGRLQRVWEDAEAGVSLTCSLLLRPKLTPDMLPLVTLATAIAATDAIADFGLAAGIKWPNDVVLGTRKCVGILCEMATDPDGALCIVAGTGFNVNQRSFEGELADKATSLYIAGGVVVDRRALLCRYLLHMERAMHALETEGLPGILPQYTARSVTLAHRVQVIGAKETFEGIAESIDATGALHVRDDAGALRRVLSGDVSVRGVMGYV